MASREMSLGYIIIFLLVLLFFQIHRNLTLTKEMHDRMILGQQTQSISDQSNSLYGKFMSWTSKSSCHLDESVVKMYEIQLDRRVNLMKYAMNDKNENNGFAMLYNGIVPEVFCPSLVRVGNVDDGGKWVCHPVGMPDGCAIMSLGVAGDTTFEREIQQITNQKCSVNSYDMNDPGPAINGFDKINAFFHKAIISSEDKPNENKRSVKGEMTRLGIKRIEILKIDIEGTEFQVIPDLIEQATFCQILIEIHGTPNKVIKLITQMAHKKYRMFSYEINGRFHILSEYSFIHEDCLSQYSATPLVYYWHLVN